MTHQPPLPEAATSPYPLHPAPLSDRQPVSAPDAKAPAKLEDGRRSITIAATIGLGAAALLAGLFYWGRRPTKSAARPKSGRGGDDKSKRGKGDRSRIAASEPYEVAYFARKQQISMTEARAILKEAGPDRKSANALAARRKAA
jgi:hypothetical protein